MQKQEGKRFTFLYTYVLYAGPWKYDYWIFEI